MNVFPSSKHSSLSSPKDTVKGDKHRQINNNSLIFCSIPYHIKDLAPILQSLPDHVGITRYLDPGHPFIFTLHIMAHICKSDYEVNIKKT